MQTSIQSLDTGTSTAHGFSFQPHRSPQSSTPLQQADTQRNSLANSQRYSAVSIESDRKPSTRTDVGHRFGQRLRELRRERSLTQVRMAAEFGIDRSFISDVERGKKSLSLPMLEVIALGMKVSLSELLRDI